MHQGSFKEPAKSPAYTLKLKIFALFWYFLNNFSNNAFSKTDKNTEYGNRWWVYSHTCKHTYHESPCPQTRKVHYTPLTFPSAVPLHVQPVNTSLPLIRIPLIPQSVRMATLKIPPSLEPGMRDIQRYIQLVKTYRKGYWQTATLHVASGTIPRSCKELPETKFMGVTQEPTWGNGQ